MVASLSELPAELYETIIQHFEPEDSQRYILAFTRAIPYAAIPLQCLFEHVRIRHQEQVSNLYRRLRKAPQDAALVRTLSMESWVVDADVLVNLLAMLLNVHRLTLFIGPNFTPEHLEEMFETPRTLLKDLSLRFRPYVQKATYYQFMKGAYFDSFLGILSQWPKGSLQTLSMIQDPLDTAMAPKEKFAQPLVFFRLDPIGSLASSPFLSTAGSLRFRVPGRDIARFLAEYPGALPEVELLDMATCRVTPAELQRVMWHVPRLKFLILDGCPVVTQRADALDAEGAEDYSHWATLGQSLATMGLEIARSRERKLQTWLENLAYAHGPQDGLDSASTVQQSPRKQRKRNKVALSPFTLRDSKLGSGAHISQSRPAGKKPAVERIRIIPPVPSYCSIALTAPMLSNDNSGFAKRCEAACAAFELGWAEGLAMVTKKRALVRISWGNGTRTMQITRARAQADGPESDAAAGEEEFNGLEEVTALEEFEIVDERCPRLCFAGPHKDGPHTENCPHRVSWDVFMDEL